MKAKLMVALFAATALMPVAAIAQDGGRREARQQQRAERQAQRGAQPQQAAQRPAQNVDRQAMRAQRQAQRAQSLSNPAARERFTAQRQAVLEGRGERQATRNPRFANPGQVQGFRQERRDDRQAFRTERRDDRQDFRQERREDRAQFQGDAVKRGQFRADRRDDRQDFRADRRDDRQDFRRDRLDDRRDYGRPNGNRGINRGLVQNDRRYFGNNNFAGRGYIERGGWNRGWRSDNRYDWRDFRQSNRGLYRLPRYYAPQGYGYGYQRFGIGVTLGSILFAQNYWINDPWSYRLPPVDGPYRWVRYYNDAMLVDIDTGEVVDVEYDIFW